MQLLLRWVISAAALYATVWILHAIPLGGTPLATFEHAEWYGWFIAAVVMGLVNSLIRPIARMIAAPLNCFTFGLIGILVNGLMFLLVPVTMKTIGMPVFEVHFLGAVLGAILVGLIGGVASKFIRREDERE